MNRTFIRHYIEMVVVMFVGMGVVALPVVPLMSAMGTSTSEAFDAAPAAYLLGMATSMSVPMVAWMLWRGHAWRPSLEMAASMYVPTFAAIGLLALGIVTDKSGLLVIQHNAMLPAMLAAMLLRREEYSHSHSHARHAARAEAA